MTPLTFEVLSGGTITIARERCPSCRTKACIAICALQSPGPVLVLEGEAPALKPTFDEVKRGVCTECLGCLTECETKGEKAVRIDLPLPGLQEYVASCTQAGTPPVYNGGGDRGEAE